MKKFAKFISLLGVSALVLTASAAWAQPGMGQGFGQGRGARAGKAYKRMYNPQTVETLSGTVVKLEKTTYGRRGRNVGMHLTLKTAKETIQVQLGPSWYVEKQGMTLASGDQVEVTGSRVTFRGQPAIIAAEVKKGAQVWKLRDAAGVPVWAGQRRR
jgi:hypothetical protein